MNAARTIALCLLTALSAAGCEPDSADEQGSLSCGQGELVLVGSNAYCVFESKVVIETGFNCPEGTLPAEHEGTFLCATPGGLDDAALSELDDALDAMSNGLDRPEPVKPLASAALAAMTGDERAADNADEAAAAAGDEVAGKSGTEEASGF